MPMRFNDPDHWTRQAAHIRALAETAGDSARAELLILAKDYDFLAERAQRRAQGTRE